MSLIIFVVFMLIIVFSYRAAWSVANKKIQNKYTRRFSLFMIIVVLSVFLFTLNDLYISG